MRSANATVILEPVHLYSTTSRPHVKLPKLNPMATPVEQEQEFTDLEQELTDPKVQEHELEPRGLGEQQEDLQPNPKALDQ